MRESRTMLAAGISHMLDAYDVKLLSALQRKGDAAHVELAESVHLSPSQCARRIERLRKHGYIEKVVCLLNPAALGLQVMAHSLLSLRAHDAAQNASLQQFLLESPEVLECHAQTGDADMILKIVARDLPHLSDFIDRLIAVTGGLASLRTGVVLKSIKTTTELPLRAIA